MKWSDAGLLWTISTTGWTVIAIVTHLPEATICAAGCGVMAGMCIWISNT